MRHSLGRLSNEEGDVNKNGKKSIGFDWQNKTLHVHHDFLYISLPSLHDYNVKVISRFVEDVSTRQRLLFLSLKFYRTTKVPLRQPSVCMVCRPSKKKRFSFPPASLFGSRLSFLLFVISNVCTNKNQQAKGLLPVLQCVAQKEIRDKEENHESFQAG